MRTRRFAAKRALQVIAMHTELGNHRLRAIKIRPLGLGRGLVPPEGQSYQERGREKGTGRNSCQDTVGCLHGDSGSKGSVSHSCCLTPLFSSVWSSGPRA